MTPKPTDPLAILADQLSGLSASDVATVAEEEAVANKAIADIKANMAAQRENNDDMANGIAALASTAQTIALQKDLAVLQTQGILHELYNNVGGLELTNKLAVDRMNLADALQEDARKLDELTDVELSIFSPIDALRNIMAQERASIEVAEGKQQLAIIDARIQGRTANFDADASNILKLQNIVTKGTIAAGQEQIAQSANIAATEAKAKFLAADATGILTIASAGNPEFKAILNSYAVARAQQVSAAADQDYKHKNITGPLTVEQTLLSIKKQKIDVANAQEIVDLGIETAKVNLSTMTATAKRASILAPVTLATAKVTLARTQYAHSIDQKLDPIKIAAAKQALEASVYALNVAKYQQPEKDALLSAQVTSSKVKATLDKRLKDGKILQADYDIQLRAHAVREGDIVTASNAKNAKVVNKGLALQGKTLMAEADITAILRSDNVLVSASLNSALNSGILGTIATSPVDWLNKATTQDIVPNEGMGELMQVYLRKAGLDINSATANPEAANKAIINRIKIDQETIVSGDTSNKFNDPGVEVMGNIQVVKDTALYKKVLSVSTTPITNHNQMLRAASTALRAGKLSLDETVYGISTYYTAVTAYNTASTGVIAMNAPPQVGYPAEISEFAEEAVAFVRAQQNASAYASPYDTNISQPNPSLASSYYKLSTQTADLTSTAAITKVLARLTILNPKVAPVTKEGDK